MAGKGSDWLVRRVGTLPSDLLAAALLLFLPLQPMKGP